MSRHKKVRALDYDEEYDDYYGAFDDEEDDFNEDAFEAKYLSSGIDLNAADDNNKTSTINKSRQKILDEVRLSSDDITPILVTQSKSTEAEFSIKDSVEHEAKNSLFTDSPSTPTGSKGSIQPESVVDSVASDLTRIAIQHLDKYQWRLPLMEMDKKFRDKTYYKHYTDTYISSLHSKLGHFLADNSLITNPMKYHLQQELDNYSKYSRMFELLTDYYQSIGGGFFSFSTPSPDEEIAIGCRLGTKEKVKLTDVPLIIIVKKPVPKQNQSKDAELQKTARFEYQGKAKKQTSASTSGKLTSQKVISSKSSASTAQSTPHKDRQATNDFTIIEDFTADHLESLSKKYKESLRVQEQRLIPTPSTSATTMTQKSATTESVKKSFTIKKAPVKKAVASNQPKPLATLTEKRHNLRQQLKRNTEPTAQDLETLKKQALQTAREYGEMIKTSRPRVNLVVVGHVDAGKSTLVGHLLFKLGQVSGKQMHRNEVDSQRSGKASFKFAWALDETSEERARGVTIDIALTKFETAHKDVVLLDAPGHVDFIPAVISGAAQADAALLIVDATRGEFETGFSSGGQTREHTLLVRSLGVKSLVVVVNKMDNVDWSSSRYMDIVEQLKPFLKQVGFDAHDHVQFVACSGLTGENLVDRRMAKKIKESSHPQLEHDSQLPNWTTMPCLLECIDGMKQPERMVDKATRVCVTDIYKGMSSGVSLGAKVVAGKIEAKQKLILLPPSESCEIKQVQVRDSREDKAFAGDIVTAIVTGVDINKIYRGCMLCDPLMPCHVTNRFQARIIMLDTANAIILKGAPIEVHINGTFESGTVRRLISLLNKNTGDLIQKRPRCIVKNSSAIIQLRLSRVVCCELYEDNKNLGRFMLRSYGKTIAAGLITKIKSAKVEKSGTKFKSKK